MTNNNTFTVEEYVEIYHQKMLRAKTFDQIETVADEAVSEIYKDDDDYSSEVLSVMLNIHKNHPANINKVYHRGLLKIYRHGPEETGISPSLKKHLRIKARQEKSF